MSEWISVNEKYPENKQQVKAMFEGNEYSAIFTDHEDYRSWTVEKDTYTGIKLPTHWMPLPQPSKNKE